jgi:hypothetical protein
MQKLLDITAIVLRASDELLPDNFDKIRAQYLKFVAAMVIRIFPFNGNANPNRENSENICSLKEISISKENKKELIYHRYI